MEAGGRRRRPLPLRPPPPPPPRPPTMKTGAWSPGSAVTRRQKAPTRSEPPSPRTPRQEGREGGRQSRRKPERRSPRPPPPGLPLTLPPGRKKPEDTVLVDQPVALRGEHENLREHQGAALRMPRTTPRPSLPPSDGAGLAGPHVIGGGAAGFAPLSRREKEGKSRRGRGGWRERAAGATTRRNEVSGSAPAPSPRPPRRLLL